MESNPFRFLIVLAAAGFVGGIVAVQAQPISGDIAFTGTVDLNAGLPSATAINGYSGLALGVGSQSGSFSSMNGATLSTYASLAFNTFGFAPGNGGTLMTGNAATSWLWEVYATGPSELFQLFPSTAITVSESGSLLSISGTGTLEDNGSFDTPGTWILSANSASPGVATLTFSASSQATPVPDGGTTVLLLGAALTGLAAIKRYLS